MLRQNGREEKEQKVKQEELNYKKVNKIRAKKLSARDNQQKKIEKVLSVHTFPPTTKCSLYVLGLK